MRKSIFCVFDSKARTFANPFTSTNSFTAIRDFATVANDPASIISKHAADFTLYELGEFDDESGLISPHPQMIFHTTALSLQDHRSTDEIRPVNQEA